MLMSKDASRYGLQAEPEPPVRSDAVRPGHPIDLRLVAETIEVELDTLRTLNPQLLHMVSPADPEFELRLPEGTAERFNSEIAAIPPEKWVSWRRHRVEEGETLGAIAQRYRVTASAIADANGLDGRTPVKVGDKLIIPAAARPQPMLGKLVRYRVHRGDTLDSIAEQFDVSVAELKRWNGLRSNHVARGTSLRVYPGGRTPPSNTKSRSKEVGTQKAPAGRGAKVETAATRATEIGGVVHRVKQGETLWSIALAYRTTVEALRGANRFLFSRPLQPGDLLMIRPPH
jgi:membrane-bound lytic murein transglycosylase D